MKLKSTLLHLLFAGMFITHTSAQDLYTGIWRAGTDSYALIGGVDWSTFVTKWQNFGNQNLRLVDISTYTVGTQRYYNGVWRAGSDAYALYAGVDWNTFVSKWQELAAKNLRLVDIETYLSGTTRLYIGVWRGGTDAYALYSGVDWNTFVTKWQQLAAQNLRLIDITTYTQNGIRLYTGVWRGGTDAYALYAGLDWANFSAKWQQLGSQNLRLISVTSYLENNIRKYIGVWRAGTDTYALWNGADWESTTSKWAELATKNLRLTMLETYDSNCKDACLNHVLMPDNPQTADRDAYNYPLKAGKYHCEGIPGTCLDTAKSVTYSWPNLQIGTKYYSRNSVLFDAKDQIFTLPFTEKATDMSHNGWLYKPGSWHHAIDYSRKDAKTFKISAAAPGRVIYIGWDWWSGNTMVISHDVGTKKDVYRTIYMHLQDGPVKDCNNVWDSTMTSLWDTTRRPYLNFLNATGCPMADYLRKPDTTFWGVDSKKIDHSLLNKTVTAGQVIGWSGMTGPGGCGCLDDTKDLNYHLHIFFAHRDPENNKWYLFDPYGIYSDPSCYPTGVSDAINTACARYPIAWKNGKPDYSVAFMQAVDNHATDAVTNKQSEAQLFVTPNPSPDGNVSAVYNSNFAGRIELNVYDKTGKLITRRTEQASIGKNIYRLSLSNVSSGIYYVRINNNGSQMVNAFVISK